MAVQQSPPAQQDGPGTQGRQPDVPPGGLLNEGGHPVVVPQVLHAGAAAGENQHLRLIQIHFIHRQIGLDRNVVGPGDGASRQGDQGRLHLRLAEQVGGDNRLRLLKAGSQE